MDDACVLGKPAPRTPPRIDNLFANHSIRLWELEEEGCGAGCVDGPSPFLSSKPFFQPKKPANNVLDGSHIVPSSPHIVFQLYTMKRGLSPLFKASRQVQDGKHNESGVFPEIEPLETLFKGSNKVRTFGLLGP